jgi:hypothetical protein
MSVIRNIDRFSSFLLSYLFCFVGDPPTTAQVCKTWKGANEEPAYQRIWNVYLGKMSNRFYADMRDYVLRAQHFIGEASYKERVREVVMRISPRKTFPPFQMKPALKPNSLLNTQWLNDAAAVRNKRTHDGYFALYASPHNNSIASDYLQWWIGRNTGHEGVNHLRRAAGGDPSAIGVPEKLSTSKKTYLVFAGGVTREQVQAIPDIDLFVPRGKTLADTIVMYPPQIPLLPPAKYNDSPR